MSHPRSARASISISMPLCYASEKHAVTQLWSVIYNRKLCSLISQGEVLLALITLVLGVRAGNDGLCSPQWRWLPKHKLEKSERLNIRLLMPRTSIFVLGQSRSLLGPFLPCLSSGMSSIRRTLRLHYWRRVLAQSYMVVTRDGRGCSAHMNAKAGQCCHHFAVP